jgi:hypothetical protein
VVRGFGKVGGSSQSHEGSIACQLASHCHSHTGGVKRLLSFLHLKVITKAAAQKSGSVDNLGDWMSGGLNEDFAGLLEICPRLRG